MKPKSLKLKLLTLAILAASGGANAQQTLEKAVVNSTEIQSSGARIGEDAGAKITTVDQIEEQQAATLAEALRKNSSVQINEVNGTRGSEIVIRGMTGTSVSVRVEGAAKNLTQIMHKSSNDRDTVWLNMDMFETVTAIPGAASNIYGNGSLGGVVLLETKDPEGLLGNNNWAGNIRATGESNGAAEHISGDVAHRFNEQFSANATISIKNTDAYEDANGELSSLGDTGSDDISYLLKAVYSPSATQRLEFSMLNNEQTYSNHSTINGSDLLAETKVEAVDETLSVQYTLNPLDNDWLNLKARASFNSIDRVQLAEGATDWVSSGGVDTAYFELENVSSLAQKNSLTHTLHYGADYTKDDIDMSYGNVISDDGLTRLDSATKKVQSDRTQVGAFISDNLEVGENLVISASARYDKYTATRRDVEREGEASISEKLSVIWHPFEDTAAYGFGFTALIGAGFRSPTIVEVYGKGGGTAFDGSDIDGDGIYTASNDFSCTQGHGSSCIFENEKLKGESSVNTEIGIIYDRSNLFTNSDAFSAKLNFINNDIEDKIESISLGTLDPNVATYNGTIYKVNQNVNVAEAEVYGWEASVDYQNSYLFANLSVQKMTGNSINDDGTKTSLNSVIPRSISLTLGAYFNDTNGRVGIDMHSRAAREYMSTGRNPGLNIYPDYEIFDLFASYKIQDNLTLQARVANLTDELYTKSQLSIDNVSNEDTTTYYAGRNFKMTIAYTF